MSEEGREEGVRVHEGERNNCLSAANSPSKVL